MSKQSPRTIDIHGRAYETVASRVSRFREDHADWTLQTKIITLDETQVVIEAQILNQEGRQIANGHAQEFRNSSQINKTSYLENCETSAIGRALAALGIGGSEFATANEVMNAIHQQGKPQTPVQAVVGDWGNENPDQAEILRDLAAELVDLIEIKNEPRIAYLKLVDQALDADQKSYLWLVLSTNSKTRAALKKQAELDRTAA